MAGADQSEGGPLLLSAGRRLGKRKTVRHSIESIAGIDRVHRQKLAQVEILTVEGLLETCGDRDGRERIAEATGMSAEELLHWVSLADLMRIKGIGEEYGGLLEAAGVSSVTALRKRRAAQLAAQMDAINTSHRFVRHTPGFGLVADWIAQAKQLAPVVSF